MSKWGRECTGAKEVAGEGLREDHLAGAEHAAPAHVGRVAVRPEPREGRAVGAPHDRPEVGQERGPAPLRAVQHREHRGRPAVFLLLLIALALSALAWVAGLRGVRRVVCAVRGAAAADAKLVADAGAGEAADLGVVAMAQEPYGRLLERWQLAPGSCTMA